MRHGALQEQPKEQRTSRCRLTRGACAGAVGLRETSEIVVSLHEKKGVFTPFVMQPLPSRQRPSATSELGHWDIDFADGTLVWSEQARRLFGVDPTAPPSIEQLLSRVHPEDRSRVEEQYVRSSRSDPVYYRRPSARGLAATAGSPIPFRCAAATRRRSRSETGRAAQPPAFRRHGTTN